MCLSCHTEILDDVLGSGLGEFYEQVVVPVRSMVYSKAQRFVDVVEAVCGQEDEVNKKGESSPETRNRITEAKRDIEHLRAMMRAETSVYTIDESGARKLVFSQGKLDDAAAVPVGGILAGVLLRLHNEHITALNHWRSRLQA